MKIHPLALISTIIICATNSNADDIMPDPGTPYPVQDAPTPQNELNQIQQDWLTQNPDFVSPQIVNGQPVNPPGKYPYMVRAGGCGASLVGPYTLLCAAHCASAFNTVYIGRHNLNDSSETYETHQVAEKVIHPDYQSQTSNDHDFMMVRLKEPSSYAPVELNANLVGGDVELTVMGWGTTSSGGSASSILLEVDVDSLTNAECKTKYGANSITDDMICAGRTANGVTYDSCQGDSGGPIIEKSSGKQVGVVSWGAGCADPNKPGVYSRVSDQVVWIQSYIDLWANGGPPTPAPAPCEDKPNWVDTYGDGCSWYAEDPSTRCSVWGDCCDAGFGTANEACCVCDGGIKEPVTPAPVTVTPAPQPVVTPAPVGSDIEAALALLYQARDILESLL
mmetsp:Transcript_14747/g.22882  ORF Transcript_14747/g.22882 Transcript_14747/m.22882 type:complete len:393 (+) Transcript_14747:172-1350(+)|eukprot:CAMPEP_0196811022 /NCGR_PEP_ID=MMETSP1362-20130617/16612_1 /TAXON_ID=163516 /ORGANISM="Leptocylindrus danicus, Strain CCMP1856" /LENGTH=392 /DNA_ID=CAMNT_0042186257 /DNA_START=126 /DNA_END=1304 /DNA_ORIENTATION=+